MQGLLAGTGPRGELVPAAAVAVACSDGLVRAPGNATCYTNFMNEMCWTFFEAFFLLLCRKGVSCRSV